jgi:hypothetical protein
VGEPWPPDRLDLVRCRLDDGACEQVLAPLVGGEDAIGVATPIAPAP